VAIFLFIPALRMIGMSVKKTIDGRGGCVTIAGRHCVRNDHISVLIPEGELLGSQPRHIVKTAGSRADRLACKSIAQPRQPRFLDRSTLGLDDPLFKGVETGMGCGVKKAGSFKNVEAQAREERILQIPFLMLLEGLCRRLFELEPAALPVAMEIGNPEAAKALSNLGLPRVEGGI